MEKVFLTVGETADRASTRRLDPLPNVRLWVVVSREVLRLSFGLSDRSWGIVRDGRLGANDCGGAGKEGDVEEVLEEVVKEGDDEGACTC